MVPIRFVSQTMKLSASFGGFYSILRQKLTFLEKLNEKKVDFQFLDSLGYLRSFWERFLPLPEPKMDFSRGTIKSSSSYRKSLSHHPKHTKLFDWYLRTWKTQ